MAEKFVPGIPGRVPVPMQAILDEVAAYGELTPRQATMISCAIILAFEIDKSFPRDRVTMVKGIRDCLKEFDSASVRSSAGQKGIKQLDELEEARKRLQTRAK